MMTENNVSLKLYNTFGISVKARSIIHFEQQNEILDYFKNNWNFHEPFLIIGEGSNILFRNDYNGIVFHPIHRGIHKIKEDQKYVWLYAEGGENWDHFVEYCVQNNFGGVENLSFIPGTVGATPVQNIGAYGMEVSETIEEVKALDLQTAQIVYFSNEDCKFSYRNSIFKQRFKNRYFILGVSFRLTKNPSALTEYGALKEEMKKYAENSIQNVRKAVIDIRKKKLPDPQKIGNGGSFFKNPVIPEYRFQKHLKKIPSMPYYRLSKEKVKIPAAWLIEQCGWKGERINDAGVHKEQALVLVNHGNASGEEIYQLAQKVKASVYKNFNIELEEEVRIISP